VKPVPNVIAQTQDNPPQLFLQQFNVFLVLLSRMKRRLHLFPVLKTAPFFNAIVDGCCVSFAGLSVR
jgi:hypothetical protein